MRTTRTELPNGFYVLKDEGNGSYFLFDSDGSFIGAYPSVRQAAGVAAREVGA